ncbi:hypothetical protein D3C87_602740 [compost metagenome]
MGLLDPEVEVKEVTWIRKPDREDRYSRIEAVGGGTILGGWEMSLDEAINRIRGKTLKLYTQVRGHRQNVIVVTQLVGLPYLRTEPDGDTPDNLLKLPPRPW